MKTHGIWSSWSFNQPWHKHFILGNKHFKMPLIQMVKLRYNIGDMLIRIVQKLLQACDLSKTEKIFQAVLLLKHSLGYNLGD